MKLLRDTPTKSGDPRAAIRGSALSSARLCSNPLPKPTPGSSAMASRDTPAAMQACRSVSRKPHTSATTSWYCGCCCMVRGSPCMCIKHTPTPACAAQARAPGARKAYTSLTMQAPAAAAAAITPGLLVSMEMATSRVRAMRSMTGSTRCDLHRFIHRRGAGPGRFSAHIDDGGAFIDHGGGALESGVRAGVAAAVGERVRGHVENAHDHGPPQIDDSMPATPLHDKRRPMAPGAGSSSLR